MSELARVTSDLEVGLFVYNAGGDDRSAAFLDKDLGTHLELVRRNCVRCSKRPTGSAFRWWPGGEGPWCW